jgi:hypothetical protein
VKNLTWQNPEQLFVAQVLINKVKSKCCGIKAFMKDNVPADMNYVETQPYPLMFLPLHFLWSKDDTKNFE